MKMFTGKKIAIIGGSAGMGLGIARLAVELGADVIIGSRHMEKIEAALALLDGKGSGFQIDTREEDSVIGFFEKCGPLDHLATPGSSVRTGLLRETSKEDWEYSIESKLLGQALCAKHATISENGSIVFFSGILAQRPGKSSLLGSINAAVECLAKGLALELAPIRVNVVSPGITAGTEAFQGMTDEARDAMFDSFRKKLPMQTVGCPEDMAQAAIFLMSAPFVTGHVLCVDGGGLLV